MEPLIEGLLAIAVILVLLMLIAGLIWAIIRLIKAIVD